jgi:hypothetical protein
MTARLGPLRCIARQRIALDDHRRAGDRDGAVAALGTGSLFAWPAAVLVKAVGGWACSYPITPASGVGRRKWGVWDPEAADEMQPMGPMT